MKKEKQKWNWHHENRFPSITLGFDENIYNAAIHFFLKKITIAISNFYLQVYGNKLDFNIYH